MISFHSLEDREVKQFMLFCSGRKKTTPSQGALDWSMDHEESGEEDEQDGEESERDEPTPFLPSFRLVSVAPRGGGKWTAPTKAEVALNPRSRSARLRVAERTQFPPLHPFR